MNLAEQLRMKALEVQEIAEAKEAQERIKMDKALLESFDHHVQKILPKLHEAANDANFEIDYILPINNFVEGFTDRLSELIKTHFHNKGFKVQIVFENNDEVRLTISFK